MFLLVITLSLCWNVMTKAIYKILNWTYGFKGLESMMEERKTEGSSNSWDLSFWSTRRKRENNGIGMTLWNLKVCLQWHTPPPQRPNLINLPKQSYKLGANFSNKSYRCHFHSNNFNLKNKNVFMHLGENKF